MYDTLTYATAKRVLTADDIAGIKAIYPSCTLPVAPGLNSPTNGLSVTTTPYSFTWAAVAGATSYDLQVNSKPDFSTGTSYHTGTVGNVISHSVSLPNNGTTLYWHVRAYNSCGAGPYAAYRSFTSGTAP